MAERILYTRAWLETSFINYTKYTRELQHETVPLFFSKK